MGKSPFSKGGFQCIEDQPNPPRPPFEKGGASVAVSRYDNENQTRLNRHREPGDKIKFYILGSAIFAIFVLNHNNIDA